MAQIIGRDYPDLPTPPQPPEPEPAASTNISAQLNSITSLIDSTLFTFYLSGKVTEQELKEALEQIYAASLDEIEKSSIPLALTIASDLSKGCDGSFKAFETCFTASDSNRKNGLSVPAETILEKLESVNENGTLSSYISRIRKLISQADASQIDLSGYGSAIRKLIDNFGNLTVDFHSKILYEFVETGDKTEFERRTAYYRKAFFLYSKLNNRYCTEIRAAAQELYQKAEYAYSEGRYQDAIDLYQQVIASDAAFAAQNGCKCKIGSCHVSLGDYEKALSSYKESIAVDTTDPYKRASYDGIVNIFMVRLPRTEANLLRGINYITQLMDTVQDEKILIKSRYDRGWICEYLASVSGITPEKKEEYYLAAIKWLEEYLGVYKPGDNLAEPYYVSYKICLDRDNLYGIYQLSNEKKLTYCKAAVSEYLKYEEEFSTVNPTYAVQSLTRAGDLCYSLPGYSYTYHFTIDQKKDLYKQAIAAYEKVRAKYSDNAFYYEGALEKLGYSHEQLGGAIYDEHYSDTGERIYNRAELLTAADFYEKFIQEYPQSNDMLEARGSVYSTIASSYKVEGNLADAKKNYEKANSYLKSVFENTGKYDYERLRSQNKLSANLWAIGTANWELAGNKEVRNKYGQQAIGEYQKIIDFPKADSYTLTAAKIAHGDIEKGCENYAQAIKWYDQLILDYGAGTDYLAQWAIGSSWLGLGDCYYAVDDYQTALAKYKTLDTLSNAADYKPSSKLGQGKCEAKLKNYSHAQELLALVVENYHEGAWYYDKYVIPAKDTLKDFLHVKIDPMIDTIAEGEKKTFTATIVYPDDTQAMVPSGSIREWKWEETGNEGDGHVFEPSGNTATYKGGTGDFQDTILTAKCRIDAGGYGARAVSSEIWIEGDNQVPVSLVNEDGKRIKFAPMYIPWDGAHRGMPPEVNTPLPMTLKFSTQYSVENPDQIRMYFTSPAETHETEIIYDETDVDSHVFESQDKNSIIEIVSPLPMAQNEAMPRNFPRENPGEDLLKFNLKYSGEVIFLELPIWKGPGYGTNETRLDNYAASNQVFPREKCADLNPEKYLTKNTRMFIRVADSGMKADSVTVKIKSSIEEREIICNKTGPGIFLSSGIVPLNKEYSQDIIALLGKTYGAFRTNPDSSLGSHEIELDYSHSKQGSVKHHYAPKKPALVIMALPATRDIDQESEGLQKALQAFYKWDFKWNASRAIEIVTSTIDSIQRCYSVDVNLSPTYRNFDVSYTDFIPLQNYDVVYITAHGEEMSDYSAFDVYENSSDWDAEKPATYLVKADQIYQIYALDKETRSNKLIILNCCYLGAEKNINHWFKTPSSLKGFHTKCLLGWVGTPPMILGTGYFKIFFDHIDLKRPTTILEASLIPDVPVEVYQNARGNMAEVLP
ncbi:MAG: hypothetical protein PHW04_13915 [Candidatus Wallbacteria bacterium]|nr:hypothetical protein [Candidatus Wallbacteria bacterium]